MAGMKKRLTIEVKTRAIDALKRLSKCTTYADTIRRALAIAHMCVDHEAKGGKIVLRAKDGSEEITRVIL